MRRTFKRFLEIENLPLLSFSLAPALSVLLFWSNSNSKLSYVAKSHALHVIAIEFAIIILAVRKCGLPHISRQALVALAILIGIMWTSAVLAPSNGRSLLWTGFWMVHIAFGYAVTVTFDVKTAIESMLLGFLLFVGLLLVRFYAEPVGDWESDPPGLGHIRRYGYYAAAVAAMAVSYKGKPRREVFAAVIAALGFTIVFWTGARGAFAALGIGCSIAFIVFRELRTFRFAIVSFSTAILGFVIATFIPAPEASMGVGRMGSSMIAEDFSSGRIEMWGEILQAIAEKPIFGWGEAQSHLFAPLTAQPHNIVLQVILAWGLAGALFVSIFVAWAAGRAYRNARASSALLPPSVALIVLLVYSLFDGTLFHVHSVSIFAMCTGLVLATSSQSRFFVR